MGKLSTKLKFDFNIDDKDENVLDELESFEPSSKKDKQQIKIITVKHKKQKDTSINLF